MNIPGNAHDRSGSRRPPLVRAGIALGLTAAVSFTGACGKRGTSSGSGLSAELQQWHKDYRAAVNDMSEAAGGDKDLKDACQQALNALETHESKLVDTPDEKLSELTKQFVEERKEAYKKCAETGEAPASSKMTVLMEKRLRELAATPTPAS